MDTHLEHQENEHIDAEDVEGIEEDEAYIDQNDVLGEVDDDDNDQPMDEDDEQADVDGDTAIVLEDTSVQHFPEHGKSVFVVNAHPTQPLAVSGGEDDFGYIWNVQSGDTVVKLTGHNDSVTCANFSADGELVSTGGMDGKVRVWRHVGKDTWTIWEFLTELQGPDEVNWLRWHPRGPVLLAGANDGTVWLWQLPSGNTMQVFAGHSASVQCGEFTPDGKRIVTADESGTLLFWDPRSPTPIFKLTADDARFALPGGITALAVNGASTLAVAGGASGGVRVVSLNRGEVVGALDGHKEEESIEAVVFVDIVGAGTAAAGGAAASSGAAGVLVTAGTDGKACVWDLSTMRLRTTMEHDDVITSLLAHPSPKNHLLTTASSDRTLRTWDVRTGKLLKEHKGHSGPILSAALALASSVVVSAGDEGVCLVFSTEE